LVITQILRGTFDFSKSPESSDLTQQYLNNAIRAIERSARSGIPQSPLLEAAWQAIEGATPGKGTTLEQMRRQVAAKVERYIEQSHRSAQIVNIGEQMNTTIRIGEVSVTGDFSFVTARNIQDSFNKSSSTVGNTQLKQTLQALTAEVGRLAAKLSKDEAEKVSQDLQTLTSEATSKSPRRKWYELSAEGLIEAAKTVAEMAEPVSTAVKAVLALLTV
jgi:ribosome recycling factor